MKIKLKNTPEQVELIKAMGSRNAIVAREAQEAFAAFLGPVVQKVLYKAGTSSAIYTDAEYDEDDSPSYPLDLYYNETAGYIQVWHQNTAGGLPTSEVTGGGEVKFQTYRLDSAVSFQKRYARRSRLDVVSKAVERMSNEVLVKQERNAWAVILKALANGSTTPKGGSALKHVITSATTTFGLADLNALMTRMKRINSAYDGGTPVAPYSKGITDLYVSPEIMQRIRAFSFTPLNTSTSINSAPQLPEAVREEIYRAAGAQSIFGVNLNELLELGVSKKYNVLFGSFLGAGNNLGNAAGSTDFSTSGDELIVGIDNSKGAFIRPVARQAESGGTFTAIPDDQFNNNRADKTGFYGFIEEGRMCLDARAIVGISVVDA
jgi:hypothetical protein